MVRKLFKHELLANIRIILPLHIILLGIACLGRLIQLFETDSIIYNIVLGSSIFVFVLGILACLILTEINAIARFFRNLFSGEGYLSFTLPVSSTAHILVKATVAVLMTVGSFLASLLACGIMIDTEFLAELYKAAAYLLRDIPQTITPHLPLYAAEILILFIATLYCSYLLFYTCIAIGQMARKARFFAAVGVYFGYYTFVQILSTVGIILVTVFEPYFNWERIGTFISQNLIGCVHGFFGILIFFTALMTLVYFVITRLIIHHKLNLE